MWYSLDPEVIGRQFAIINLQHDPGILQGLLSHLNRENSGKIKFWYGGVEVSVLVYTEKSYIVIIVTKLRTPPLSDSFLFPNAILL